ncbi:MAG: exodeoxyribonuclease III [Alphaproteobacteria bacterium]|nr:exodeoxyribonuclease III [Alphaproteobacteria bacterium]
MTHHFLKIATWNINSVRARLPLLLAWLQQHKPDVLMLQEIKCEHAVFPFLEIEAMGYTALVHGQKSYNGVAILSTHPIQEKSRSLISEDNEPARFLCAEIEGVDCMNIYAPNGNPRMDDAGLTEKFRYKLRWYAALVADVQQRLSQHRAVVLAGDYNIIPEAVDAANAAAWEGDALYVPEVRKQWRHLMNLGLYDAWRTLHGTQQAYTFWDYQAGAWERNNGIRIDHILSSPRMMDRVVDCFIDPCPRGWDKPSDHVPVVVDI